MNEKTPIQSDTRAEVSLKEYVERIFDERDKASEFARLQLERALIEARSTTERAMNEARDTVNKALIEAKTAADDRFLVQQKRIDLLESGGAPFASRLDESLAALKMDVDNLKVDAVRTKVLDALREQTVADLKVQRRQLKYVFITAGVSFGVSLILVGIQVLGR